jgi:hypothetical protein
MRPVTHNSRKPTYKLQKLIKQYSNFVPLREQSYCKALILVPSLRLLKFYIAQGLDNSRLASEFGLSSSENFAFINATIYTSGTFTHKPSAAKLNIHRKPDLTLKPLLGLSSLKDALN